MVHKNYVTKLPKGVKEYLKTDISSNLKALKMHQGYASTRLGKRLLVMRITDSEVVSEDELRQILALL